LLKARHDDDQFFPYSGREAMIVASSGGHVVRLPPHTLQLIHADPKNSQITNFKIFLQWQCGE
jgi:hypothetical protein